MAGVLNVDQINNSAGSGAPTFPNGITTASFTAKTQQTFTSGSGTYTLPTSPRSPIGILVTCVGPGGGGGGVATTSSNSAGGGGGGGGGWCRKWISSPNATYSYGVGSGGAGGTAGNNSGSNGSGATTFGTLTANLGQGGSGMGASAAANAVSGGVGGTATGGDSNVPGSQGYPGLVLSSTIASGGAGGYNPWGTGGNATSAGGTAAGSVGGGYGGGGSGGNQSNNGGAQAGGAGANGFILVEEFYQ